MKVRPFLLVPFFLLSFYQYSVTQLPKNVGKGACFRCHEMEHRTMSGTPHDQGKTCEGCHGSAEQHLSSGGDANVIFSYRRATAEEVRARCGQCHDNPVMAKHAVGDVTCTTCHSAHHYVRRKYLLKADDPEMKPS